MRLLIVDDEHYIVNYLAALVEAHAPEDLEVYKCYSGMEALELSKTMKIHLALLDIRMPGLSGIETASRIRTSDPDFRVIFLTAFDNFEHIYAADKLPHSRYLLKTEKDEVILSEIFSAVDEIKQEADKLHLLSTASQNSLLLSHLLEQTILKEIFSGEHMDKIQQSLQIAWSKFPLDLQRPVYLMYTQIHHRSSGRAIRFTPGTPWSISSLCNDFASISSPFPCWIWNTERCSGFSNLYFHQLLLPPPIRPAPLRWKVTTWVPFPDFWSLWQMISATTALRPCIVGSQLSSTRQLHPGIRSTVTFLLYNGMPIPLLPKRR